MKGEKLGPLHGLPLGIKDLEATKGLRTTWGSPLFADHVPDHDEGMVRRLREAGGNVLGKTNVPEFGLGANSRNTVWGATGNAFNPVYNAAGSSGGSAVALATNMVPLASGSDTGGSLRNPAAFNGIVGYRPSSGLVPSERRGHGWSPLPMLGPMARNVPDLALMLGAMASDDVADPLAYSFPGVAMRERPGLFHPVQPADLASMKLAFTEDFGLAPTVKLGIGTPTEITLGAILQHRKDQVNYGVPNLNGFPLNAPPNTAWGFADDYTEQDVIALQSLVEHKF
eukprot:gene51079-62463_t